jgi:hypothetical protein
MFKNWYKENKALIIAILISLICMAIGWITYILFGHQLIKAIYEGRSIEFLNKIFEGQSVHPVEFYYKTLDTIFFSYLVLFAIFVIFFITFKLLLAWDWTDLFIAALTSTALLFFSGLIVKRILFSALECWGPAWLAWPVSLKYGYQLYYTADTGPVTSIIYPPLRAFIYLPVTLLSSPAPAIILSAFIDACFYFMPIYLLHIRKNLSNTRKLLFAHYAFASFCLFTFISQVLNRFVDAVPLGIAAAACAILYYRKHKDSILSLLLSATFSVLAVWSKQTMVPLLVALPIYVLLADGYRCFKRYVLCLFVSGVVISVLLLWISGPRNLFFYIFTLPYNCPWKYHSNRVVALFISFLYLIKESFVFVVLLIFYSWGRFLVSNNIPNKLNKWLNDNRWAMLVIISLFMIPTSVLGRVKEYSGFNTLAPTVYFLVAALSLALMESISSLPSPCIRLRQRFAKLLPAILITVFICVKIPEFCDIRTILYKLSGRDNYQNVAYEYAKRHPGEAYFPYHPLPSLMAEGKLYHFEFGLHDRDQMKFPVSYEHFKAHIPADMQLIAFPSDYAAPYFTMKYLPEFSQRATIDELPGWIVYTRK